MTRRKRPPVDAGIDALLGKSSELAHAPAKGRTMPVADLRPGSSQPRREFDAASLDTLAQSIRDKGVLQPLLVRAAGEGHEIVAGERRWRAAQLAGLTEVPVIVRELTDAEAREIALIENLQREDLNLLDEVDGKLALVTNRLGLESPEAARARLMQMLREEPGDDHAALEVAFGALGESWQGFAKGKLRVLGWPDAVLAAVRAGLPFALARVVVGAAEQHQAALLTLAAQGASRSELQAEAARLAAPAQVAAPRAARVSRLLGNSRFLAKLSESDQKLLERWLEKMPAALKQQLGE